MCAMVVVVSRSLWRCWWERLSGSTGPLGGAGRGYRPQLAVFSAAAGQWEESACRGAAVTAGNTWLGSVCVLRAWAAPGGVVHGLLAGGHASCTLTANIDSTRPACSTSQARRGWPTTRPEPAEHLEPRMKSVSPQTHSLSPSVCKKLHPHVRICSVPSGPAVPLDSLTF